MPTIQSKKYEDRVHYVTVEDWQVFKDKGLDTRYKVIDDADIQDTVIETPHSFKMNEVRDLTPLEAKETTREELKEILDKMEVEYDSKAKKEVLYQLYIDNQ